MLYDVIAARAPSCPAPEGVGSTHNASAARECRFGVLFDHRLDRKDLPQDLPMWARKPKLALGLAEFATLCR